jgi:hypothetical protein
VLTAAENALTDVLAAAKVLGTPMCQTCGAAYFSSDSAALCLHPSKASVAAMQAVADSHCGPDEVNAAAVAWDALTAQERAVESPVELPVDTRWLRFAFTVEDEPDFVAEGQP